MKQAFDVVHAMRPGLLQLQSLPPLSLYVHLPWCIQKCPYCDFNSHEWRDNSQAMPEQRYIDALLADLETSLPLVWVDLFTVFSLAGVRPVCSHRVASID
jgi:coproporphyrinogen III oxidase-like Fe-S oxidoreductase